MRSPRPDTLRATLLGLAGSLVLAGCGTTVIPSPAVTAPTTPVPATHVPATPVPATGLACPDLAFDPAASLGPEFANDIFLAGESQAIAAEFIDALAAVYAQRPATDPCDWFTARGLGTALLADPRLRDVIEGRSTIVATLRLRYAGEGVYDLRVAPPTVPLSIIFDVPAGSRTTDVASGATVTSPADQRTGMQVGFVFDGHRWRADRVGPIEGYDAALAVMPTPMPPGKRCTGFDRDASGARFDATRPGRTWCDADGRGRLIDDAQLALITRYPCRAGRAAVLTLGLPLGMPIDPLVRNEFVRDPAGEFLAKGWVTAPFDSSATLPSDAAYTGWTNGNVELWISPTDLDAAVYMRVGRATERWPRAADGWGVIDCN